MIQHARVDSEVGVFYYGMGMIFSITITSLLTFFSSTLWWFGLRKLTNISIWEKLSQRTIFGLSSIPLAFVIFRLVEGAL